MRMSAHCPVERTLFEARLTRDYLAKLLKIRVIDAKRDSSSPWQSSSSVCDQPGTAKVNTFSVSSLWEEEKKFPALILLKIDLKWYC